MVRYLDPEDHPELGEDGPRKRRSSSPAERLARQRERNATLTGVAAIEAAREVALRQLDTRARSTSELHIAITSRGFSEDIADEVVSRLQAVGLVDDRTFAVALARERFSGSGKVGRALVEDLRRKGLDRETIESALAEATGGGAERERAADLVAHRLRSMSGVSRDVAYRRLTGMLARKGYSPGVAIQVVREALDER